MTDSKSKLVNFKDQLSSTVKNVTGFSLSTVTAAGAAFAVGNAIKQSVTEWSAYAESVEKAARLSGVSSEEMSRLIQASDDFRVSQSSLTTAMNMALKNGFTPTIANLVKLSDEFVAMKDPAERAEMASKIFGRQWAEIEPLLRQGGDAIREGTAAIADNLVVTEEAVRENKKFIQTLDNYQDAWTGLSHTVGQEVLPVITAAMQAATEGDNLWEFIKRLRDETKETDPAIAAMTGRLDAQYQAYLNATAAAGDNADATGLVMDATNDAAAAMAKYTDALLFKLASEGLSEEAALELAYAMGLVDEKTVFATQKTSEWKKMLDDGTISLNTYNKLVADLQKNIDELHDKEVNLTFNVNTNGSIPSYYADTGYNPQAGAVFSPKATGGPVMAGVPYLVGERGPEPFIPSTNGTIMPNNDFEKLLKNIKGGEININVYGAADPQQTAHLIDLNFRAAQALAGVA